MPLNFPTSPAVNEQYTFAGRTWVWNGSAWDSYNPGITGYVSAVNGLTGILSLLPSTGISISSGGKGITLINTGVSSFNGITGDVTGVSSVCGMTGTVILPGINLYLYSIGII